MLHVKGNCTSLGSQVYLRHHIAAKDRVTEINRNCSASENSIKRRSRSLCSCINALANFHSLIFYIRLLLENAYLEPYIFGLDDCWFSCTSVSPDSLTADQIEQSFNVTRKLMHREAPMDRPTGNGSCCFELMR